MIDLDEIERRIAALEPHKVEAVVMPRKEAAPAPQRIPRGGWRFVPERDSNNLIIEIIATRIEEPVE